jgi:hypothetical protein
MFFGYEVLASLRPSCNVWRERNTGISACIKRGPHCISTLAALRKKTSLMGTLALAMDSTHEYQNEVRFQMYRRHAALRFERSRGAMVHAPPFCDTKPSGRKSSTYATHSSVTKRTRRHGTKCCVHVGVTGAKRQGASLLSINARAYPCRPCSP